MKLIIPVLLAFSGAAFAADGKSESKELALPDFSGLQQPSKKSGEGISFTAESKCTTNDGQSFSQTDTGFATCMSNNQNQDRRQ